MQKKILENNNYNPMDFYGILLCYFNYYDKDNFNQILSRLYQNRPEYLFEIILIYIYHLRYSINQNKNFYNRFIDYIISRKDFSVFKKCLIYIKDIETLVEVLQKRKEDIYYKYIKNNGSNDNKVKIIKIGGNLNLYENINLSTEDIVSTLEAKKSAEIIKNILSIIKYWEEKEIFFIYFTDDFWTNFLKLFIKPNKENIYICYEIRKLFIAYYKSSKNLLSEKDLIKFEIEAYYERDEFAFILDQIIIQFIEDNTDLTYIQKLAYITQCNPYYQDEKYNNKVNPNILNFLDLNKIEDVHLFSNDFKKMKFENIFKNNLYGYFSKLISKVKTSSDLNILCELIDVENLKEKSIFLNLLNKKYDDIIGNKNSFLTEETLTDTIKIIIKIICLNMIGETKEEKLHFIEKRKEKLNKKLMSLILIELIKIYNKDKKSQKELKYLMDFFFEELTSELKNDEDVNIIINIFNCVEEENRNKYNNNYNRFYYEIEKNENKITKEFLKKLIGKNSFTEEEFFSKGKNIKYSLLYKLIENGKLKKDDDEMIKIENVLDSIYKKIEGLDIPFKILDDFLNNDESIINQRLSLIKIITMEFPYQGKFNRLKDIYQIIKDELDKIIYIRDNIELYFSGIYQNIIKEIGNIIETIQNQKIIAYNRESTHELFKKIFYLKTLVDEIYKVKDFLLFKIIYEMNQAKDEMVRFETSLNKLKEIGDFLKKNNNFNEIEDNYKEIFEKINKELRNDYSREKSAEFYNNFIKYYEIKDENLIDTLLIIKCKRYEIDINGMIFFFSNFETDNKIWNEKLSKEEYENLSKKDFKEIKEKLIKLKDKGLYDYKNVENFNKLFTSLYEQKEAIDFLKSKTLKDINDLKDILQETDKNIDTKDIDDLEKCVESFIEMKKIKNNEGILDFIKKMEKEQILQFENYSKKYPIIIKLETRREKKDKELLEKRIKFLEEQNNELKKENENLKKRLKNYSFKLGENETFLKLNISSYDRKINYFFICKNTDIVKYLEAEIYKKYPEYYEKDNYFTYEGRIIDGNCKNLSLEMNHIKDGGTLILNKK